MSVNLSVYLYLSLYLDNIHIPMTFNSIYTHFLRDNLFIKTL